MKTRFFLLLPLSILALSSCEKLKEKVSPIGLLVAGTAVEDRVEMSYEYFQNHKYDFEMVDNTHSTDGSYTFLVGADSHLTDDASRMVEMLQIGLDSDDLLYTHLGDIADTKADYYIRLDSLIQEAKAKWVKKNYTVVNDKYGIYTRNLDIGDPYAEEEQYDKIRYPFYPVVGNHAITHNGWALWSNIFHSSFYQVFVIGIDPSDGEIYFDRFIFLDSASGTLGKKQIELIKEGTFDSDGEKFFRYTFVFSHTNIFRPQFFEFASTFTREETFFLLDQFEKWNVNCVFCGHVHTWDERDYNGVHYLTLDTMCEKNNPDPGDYLVRLNVGCNEITWEPVHMNSKQK